jgi:hypothetical protein
MQLYFAANAHLLLGEPDKVLAASTFLEGDAMDWFEPYVRSWFEETEDEREDEVNETFASYALFVRKIKSIFGEIDERNAAAQKI